MDFSPSLNFASFAVLHAQVSRTRKGPGSAPIYEEFLTQWVEASGYPAAPATLEPLYDAVIPLVDAGDSPSLRSYWELLSITLGSLLEATASLPRI